MKIKINIFIKMILLQAMFLNITSCHCSNKNYMSDSLLVNVSSNIHNDDSGLFKSIPYETSLFHINKISDKNNKKLNNDIYNPNISDMNKKQNTTNKKSTHSEYLSLQNKVKSCAKDIK